MDLFLDITLGAGLALAAGLRPFVPALVAGAFAGSHLGIDLRGGHYDFVCAGWFMAAVGLGFAALLLAEARLGPPRVWSGGSGAALSGLGLGMGAVLFAGVLGQHGDAAWPGLVGGLACAALAQRVSGGLLARVRSRLDPAASRAVGIYADAAALVLAAACVALPPLSLLALAALLRLWWSGRGGDDERYAGLRILR